MTAMQSARPSPDLLKHMHLVLAVIQRTMQRWHGRLPGGLESGDLVSVGWLALHAAERSYRPERGPFEPYAYAVVRRRVWACIREHLSLVHVPQGAWYASRQGGDSRTARAALRVRRLRRQALCLHSLASPETAKGLSARCARVEDRDEVAAALARCDERERQVLRAHHGLDGERPQTFETIGRRLGMTRAGAHWIERQALHKMRRERQQP
jgi:RNA polymerase sigma factor (sigma-70 family)